MKGKEHGGNAVALELNAEIELLRARVAELEDSLSCAADALMGEDL